MTNFERAQTYLQRGWSILPIKNGTKIPAISSWKKYQTQHATEAEVKAWLMIDPDMGWALVCGKVSGVIAVDVDAKNGGIETAKTLNLPATLVSNTGGGGNHYLYKWRQNLVAPKVGIYTGIDVRSDASYIVLPETVHASGNKYEWALDEDTPLADAPSWLEKSSVESAEKVATDWDKMFSEKNMKGMRNATAAKMAGKILYETSPELWDTLGVGYFRTWNRDFNQPKLSDGELSSVWKSIRKSHMRNNPAPADEDAEHSDNLTPTEEEDLILKSFAKNKTKGTHDLASYLTHKFNIITVGEHEREMFVYRNGVYFQAENEIIYPEIQRILRHHVTKSAKSEAFSKIADMTSYNRDVFESAPLNLIPLANGVYDMEKKVLLPHSPTYRFKYQFPVVYDQKAECPKTLAFLEQILLPEQIKLAQEWIGYYFYRLYMFKKALIFVGEGDTGKTTLLETIMNLIGRNNISSVSIQKMTADKFSAAHLYEKHGNIVDELSAKDIQDTGNFKIATGGGSITGEYKFGNQFSFHNFSKFTFACNKIPDVTDYNDDAYFNRWMVVRFEKVIEEKIPNFIKNLITEEERSGLFNWSMEGLERLLLQRKFSYSKDAQDTKREMMRSGSSIAVFCAEQLKQEVDAEISKEDMYEAYSKYCVSEGLATETIKMFGSKFLFYVPYATEGYMQEMKNGKIARMRGWRNVVTIEGEKKTSKANEQFNNF